MTRARAALDGAVAADRGSTWTATDRSAHSTMHHLGADISGRGQMYQEKQETAEYRVVYSPQVAVRDKPWGKVISAKKSGESIKTTHRSVGLPDGTWVKTLEQIAGHGQPGWLLVDGKAIQLPTLLEKVEKGRKGLVTRYKVVADSIDIRERPAVAGVPSCGTRKKGALIRADQELNGFVRVQHDFYQTGKAEPIEGWALVHGSTIGLNRPMLERWEPANALPSVTIGGVGAQGGQTSRWWVLVAEGCPVRERPWGRVLCTRNRGMLLRCDAEKDGWARIEADFTEDGILEACDAENEDSQILEGWVLLDGRDLGLPRQLVRYQKEKVPPAEEPRKTTEELYQRRSLKQKAHTAKGEDYSLKTILLNAKVSEDVISTLEEKGIDDFEELVVLVSRGDHHEELRKVGITKLGARAKLATLVQPFWKALAVKEQGNVMYKESRFEDAANLYTRAIKEIPLPSSDLALNCYSNRAACFQQMREPQLALEDVRHVLTFDPSNAKGLARKQVYEAQVAGAS